MLDPVQGQRGLRLGQLAVGRRVRRVALLLRVPPAWSAPTSDRAVAAAFALEVTDDVALAAMICASVIAGLMTMCPAAVA